MFWKNKNVAVVLEKLTFEAWTKNNQDLMMITVT
jgi:hypothetical protein